MTPAFFHRPPMDGARVALAFLLAPLAPPLTLTLLLLGSGLLFSKVIDLGFVFAAFVIELGFTVAMTIVLALPAYFVLRHRVRPRWWTAALLGASIAGLGYLAWILGALRWPISPAAPGDLVGPLGASLALAPFGAVGGLAFWAIAAWTPRARAKA